jgi:hypothetical protein
LEANEKTMSAIIDASGLPESVVSDIRQLVTTLKGQLTDTNSPGLQSETREEWVNRLTAWAQSHPKRSIEIDDSRESIYSGRGE